MVRMISGAIKVYVAVLSGIFGTLVILMLEEIVYQVLAGVMPVLSAVSERRVGVAQLLHLLGQQLVLRRGETLGGAAQCVQTLQHVIYGGAGDVRHPGSLLADLTPYLLVFGQTLHTPLGHARSCWCSIYGPGVEKLNATIQVLRNGS